MVRMTETEAIKKASFSMRRITLHSSSFTATAVRDLAPFPFARPFAGFHRARPSTTLDKVYNHIYF
jgi:hypothetical protein